MKLSSIVCASVFTFAEIALTADAASANTTSSRSNTTHNGMAGPSSPNCPTGQSWDAAAKKCLATDSINYNASKSNTGSLTATPLNNRQNVSGAAQRSSTDSAAPSPK
jgi:hypothetical protein